MAFGAEFHVFLADLSQLVGDGFELCGDGYYAGDTGTEYGKGGAITGRNGLEGVRGEILDEVRVELEAVPGLGKDFRQERERGCRLRRGAGGGRFQIAGGIGNGDGSCQGRVAWGNGRDFHQGTEWGSKTW